ncbi:MAG: hypothetical protein SchgKO_03600 [Schleiferiaceae bacterium]
MMKIGITLIAFFLSGMVTAQTWFATFNQNSNVEYSGYSVSSDLTEFRRHYDNKTNNGYVLVSSTFTDNGWFSTYQKGEEYSSGNYVTDYTLSGLKTKIRENWDQGYALGSVSYGSGVWMAIFYKSPYKYTSAYNTRTSMDQLMASVHEREAEGYHLASIAGGNGEYMATFQKIRGVTDSKVLRRGTKSDIATVIKENWTGSWDLFFVTYVGGEYIAVVYQNQYVENSAYNYKTDESVIKKDIKSRWETDYDLVSVCFEPGTGNVNTLVVNDEIVTEPAEVREYIEFSDGGAMALTNLSVVEFSNGDPIPFKGTPDEWFQAGQKGEPAYCYVNGDPSTAETYGLLYNWYAVHDSRGLSPEGYRVASPEDFEKLSLQLTSEKGTGKSQSALVDYFGVKATGCRVYKGQFRFFSTTSMWWTQAGIDAAPASYKLLLNGMVLSREEYFKEMGMAVRLVKEP